MRKYGPVPYVDFPNRTWPGKTLQKAPVWCSVDLRDGNQALVNPMSPEQKLRFYKLLVRTGFKEIEISFPSASKADYDFTRALIDDGHIPDDVTIQVLTQAREHLIKKTFESIRNSRRAIVHMYNSTSPAQREIVFSKSPKEIIALAVDGIKMIRDQVSSHNGEIVLEYSPESFSQTELSFSSDICNAVIEAWAPAPHEQVIINLPSTVEISSPNVYADQIEYMSGKLIQRKQVIVSVHTHNDRGCAVAAAELAILAGADRVEGTLIGNGERTGNADLITLAMNLFSHGIKTGLDFTNHKEISNIYTTCTGMEISQRHPYIGELVFTAFSGSHQDAISKGLHHYQTHKGSWNVPYLPIDPQDISRSYEAVIRINSQSGKGGSAYILEQFYGYTIPKEMHPELGAAVQRYADSKGTELSHNDVYNSFTKEFINVSGPIQIGKFTIEPSASPVNDALPRHVDINAAINMMNTTVNIQGRGNGFLDAFAQALNNHCTGFKIVSFNEHSLGEGSEAKAASYIQIENKSGRRAFGVGVDTDIACASLKALQNALNRAEI